MEEIYPITKFPTHAVLVMQEFADQAIFKSRVTFQILPVEFSSLIGAVDNPSALNKRTLICINTSPMNITNITGGADNQDLKILGDGFTTLVYGDKIKTNTGVDKLLEADMVYRFSYINNIWYEDAP